MRDNEDYQNARTLATVEHLGETFRVVRRRVNGKPWRKYITLCYGPHAVSDGFYDKPLEEVCEMFRGFLRSHFDTRPALLDRLKNILPPVRRVHLPEC